MQINFDKYQVNQKQRSIVFTCASDAPYQRYDEFKKYYYNEVLVITQQAVNLERLNNGSPLLYNHNPDMLLGMIQKSWIANNKIFVKVLFSKNDNFADRIYKDILDGIVKNVSIGYQINHYKEQKKQGIITRYIDDFMLYEVSIVTIPADDTVGIRNLKIKDNKNMNKKEIESEEKEITPETETVEKEEIETTPVDNAEEKETTPEDIEKLKAEIEKLKQENEALKQEAEKEEIVEKEQIADDTENEKETEEIKAIAKDFNISEDEIKSAIDNKLTVQEFKQEIRNKNFNIITKKDTKNMKFSEYLRNGNFNEKYQMRDYAGLGGQTNENGAPLIGTQTFPLIASLEKAMGVKGFRTLNGLTSNISIPVQSSRLTIDQADHLRDAADATTPAFTSKTLTPVKFAGNVRIGKEILTQCNDDIVAFIIDSINKQIAYKVEDYMLNKVASGAGNAITYSALSAIDWDDVLEMQSKVAGFNLTDLAFVLSPAARATLKGTEKATGTAQFICDAENRINGYEARVSGCVANNNIYFGDWSKLILGIWGNGLQILVDPYTYGAQGDLRIVGTLCADAVVEQADAFVKGTVTTSSSSSAE